MKQTLIKGITPIIIGSIVIELTLIRFSLYYYTCGIHLEEYLFIFSIWVVTILLNGKYKSPQNNKMIDILMGIVNISIGFWIGSIIC